MMWSRCPLSRSVLSTSTHVERLSSELELAPRSRPLRSWVYWCTASSKSLLHSCICDASVAPDPPEDVGRVGCRDHDRWAACRPNEDQESPSVIHAPDTVLPWPRVKRTKCLRVRLDRVRLSRVSAKWKVGACCVVRTDVLGNRLNTA